MMVARRYGRRNFKCLTEFEFCKMKIVLEMERAVQ